MFPMAFARQFFTQQQTRRTAAELSLPRLRHRFLQAGEWTRNTDLQGMRLNLTSHNTD
jgi:hypothetical protein